MSQVFKGNTLTTIDDGTFIVVSRAGTNLFKVRKSDGQFQVQAGFDTDITL